MRKAEMISAARKANTQNAFTIFDFCDQLKKIYEEHLDLDDPKIFNCDEIGFPINQNRGKVISVKGERALKLSIGARRENITVLGVCNVSGVAMDPFIIFKGKYFMLNWCGDKALRKTYYGNSQNGWVDSQTFAKWMKYFAE